MKNFLLAVLLAALTFVAGCVSNPVNTARGDYYALDARVTAVDAGVLSFIQQCKAAPVTAVCSARNLGRLAQATSALGTAMDGYSTAVRDPGTAQGGLQRAAAVVNAALATVTALLAEFGVSTP